MAPLRPFAGHGDFEAVPLGDGYCLLDRHTHAVALLNASGLAIAEAWLEGEAADAIAGVLDPPPSLTATATFAAVADLGAKLHDAGFRVAGPAGRTAGRPPESASEPSSGWRRRYALAPDRAVVLTCPDEPLARLLEAVLRPIEAPGDEPDAAEVSLTIGSGGFTIRRDGRPLAWDADLSDARRIAIQAVILALLGDERAGVLIHGSAVAIDGRGVVLAGATGSGKTTLAMLLAADGAEFLTDDMTPLGRDGRTLAAVPIAASVKDGSWAVLDAEFDELQGSRAVHRVGTRSVRYLDATRYRAAAPSQTAAAIVFPQYRPDGAPTTVRRLSPAEALQRLLATGTEIVARPRSVAPLVRLVETAPAHELSYSNGADAVQHVRALAGAS